MNSQNMKSLYSTLSITLALVLLISAKSFADSTTYSRDSKYIYIKTPVALTLDPQQTEAIKQATAHITAQLESIKKLNPRQESLAVQKLESIVINNANSFEQSIEQVLDFTQKYYGTAQKYGAHLYNGLPSALLLFGGIEVTYGAGASIGGAVMTGVVLLPMSVKVIDIDSNQVISQSIEVETALVVFPSANLGAGLGGGTNTRIGAGFIFGKLEKASDFKGMLMGASGSLAFKVGNNIKIQALKNWNKPGAINNVLMSIAWENGIVEKAEAHATVSYVVDAQSVFNTVGGVANAVMTKLGVNPADAKP